MSAEQVLTQFKNFLDAKIATSRRMSINSKQRSFRARMVAHLEALLEIEKVLSHITSDVEGKDDETVRLPKPVECKAHEISEGKLAVINGSEYADLMRLQKRIIPYLDDTTEEAYFLQILGISPTQHGHVVMAVRLDTGEVVNAEFAGLIEGATLPDGHISGLRRVVERLESSLENAKEPHQILDSNDTLIAGCGEPRRVDHSPIV